MTISSTLAKARKIRQALLSRANKLKRPELKHEAPTAAEVEAWIKKWQEKDGKCYYFKTNISLDKAHIDHKIPLARGGSNKLKNLAICHPRANGTKGTMTDKEYKSLLKCIMKWQDKGQDLLARLVRANTVFRRK